MVVLSFSSFSRTDFNQYCFSNQKFSSTCYSPPVTTSRRTQLLLTAPSQPARDSLTAASHAGARSSAGHGNHVSKPCKFSIMQLIAHARKIYNFIASRSIFSGRLHVVTYRTGPLKRPLDVCRGASRKTLPASRPCDRQTKKHFE